MPLEITNNFTKKREIFSPIKEGEVGLYVCGLTVYDYAHIGHIRMFLTFDVIRRFLESKGFQVRHVCNHTDVDDRIIEKALQEGIAPREITEGFIKLLEQDLKDVDILPPHIAPKVTEHIPQIIAIVKKLIEKEHAYVVGNDVYYSVKSFAPYGKLSGRSIDENRAGESGRVDQEETKRKRHPFDFVLWKGSKEGEPESVSWDSPWGKGRPGWHIECSAMCEEHLGTPFDIHGGGKDLIFPHHENEIAQSEAASGNQLCRFWIHVGHLKSVYFDENGERKFLKMSKSLKNFYTVPDLLRRHDRESYRFACLSVHYRQDINFEVDLAPDQKTIVAFPTLEDVAKRVSYGYETLRKLDRILASATPKNGTPKLPEDFSQKFLDAMDEDFNTPKAIGITANFFRYANEVADKKERGSSLSKPDRLATLTALREQAKTFATILGLWGGNPETRIREIRDKAAIEKGLNIQKITEQIEKLDCYRAEKNYESSDAIRSELAKNGIQVNNVAGAPSEWSIL